MSGKIRKKAVVVVDMQKDFIDGSLGTKEAQEMLPRLVGKLAEIEKKNDSDVFFTLDTHGEDYLSTQEGKNLPVKHCIKGTPGHELADELKHFAAKAKIEKPSFGSPQLAKMLTDYDEIELMGLCTDICVISNAMIIKAFCPEAKIAVDAACSAGVTPKSHLNALEAMKMCQITIINE